MNIIDIKCENVKRILGYLGRHPGITKRALTEATNLSFSTVSNLCNDMKDAGVLKEEKINDYSVGRNPSQLFFMADRFYAICMDVQGTQFFRVAVWDFSPQRLYESRVDIGGIRDAQELLSLMEELCASLAASPEFQKGAFVGIGISIDGIYDQGMKKIVGSSLPLLNGIPLAELLSARLKLPCFVDKASNFCAVSARQLHPDYNNILYLYGASTLDLGVICGGELFRGHRGFTAEIAHLPFGNPEIRCPVCGNYGCIENELSLSGMSRLSSPELTEEGRSMLLQDRGRCLGRLLSVLTSLFVPEAIFIGGSAFSCYDAVLPYAMEVVRQRCDSHLSGGLPIFHDPDSRRVIETGITQAVYASWNPLK
ncbi:ROK family transcriptional regulator [Clostridiaceae bacterium]|jgi:predicted NBD/HSP70 family sugar kinase|nr:ROK family transcriptional regulator [Clostridium sp.]NBI71138.1 ROK family transcriptional regulator [Clostridiaceae bacterium]